MAVDVEAVVVVVVVFVIVVAAVVGAGVVGSGGGSGSGGLCGSCNKATCTSVRFSSTFCWSFFHQGSPDWSGGCAVWSEGWAVWSRGWAVWSGGWGEVVEDVVVRSSHQFLWTNASN